ncbi:RNA-directed DNA polymerase [bacterium]|nr:RNA-directed DNA polymerase [bacterium]
MKRYGNLYPTICSMDNIRIAHLNARKGKAHYREVQMVNVDEELYLSRIQDSLQDKTFRNSRYTTFMKLDSTKERKIFKLPYFPDRIIHHCIVQVLEPIWIKTLIADTYSSLKGRGIHKGVKRIKVALKDRENTTYCLKMDVRKFYPSINHDILKTILKRKIKDPDVIWILDEIIDSTSGVPIGNYLSQHFGNLYLSGFDHWMKEEQGCKYYFRYCDDVVILHGSKEHLADLRLKASAYLEKTLKLQLKDNWQVFPVDARGIDFLGYRFYHTHTTLRKSTATQFKRTISKIRSTKSKSIGMVNSIMSYYGWMIHANCSNLFTAHVDSQIYGIAQTLCSNEDVHNPLGSGYHC